MLISTYIKVMYNIHISRSFLRIVWTGNTSMIPATQLYTNRSGQIRIQSFPSLNEGPIQGRRQHCRKNYIELQPLFWEDALILNPPYCGELPKPGGELVAMSSAMSSLCSPDAESPHENTRNTVVTDVAPWWVVIWSVEFLLLFARKTWTSPVVRILFLSTPIT